MLEIEQKRSSPESDSSGNVSQPLGRSRQDAAEKVNAVEKRDGDPAVKIDYPDHRHFLESRGGDSTPAMDFSASRPALLQNEPRSA